MPLFILCDNLSPDFKSAHKDVLATLHQRLIEKIRPFGSFMLVDMAEFSDAQAFYRMLVQQKQDVCLLNSYATALCTEDLKDFLAYQKEHLYDVLFAERLPEGLLPDFIAGEFLPELLPLIPENTPSTTPLKTLINWEFKGIDVGIWLSSSSIALERISFLPENKNSLAFLDKLSTNLTFSIEKAEESIKKHRNLIHCAPFYVAIELKNGEKHIELPFFKKIIQELDDFAPESVISLGVYEEPLDHPQLEAILACLGDKRRVLVESLGEYQDEKAVLRVFSRNNTDFILAEGAFSAKIAPSLAENPHFWVKFTRNKASEDKILPFLKNYSFLGMRAIIAKENSFGDATTASVDLSPLKRHACFALGRELVILANGDVPICRQAPHLIRASLVEKPLSEVWAQCVQDYLKQIENPHCETCERCKSCGDWWVFNF
ncbi:MAG: SPASM domain-containing protein [Brevinema sp.]